MVIKPINPLDYPNWNEQVSELHGATIFHTANWARVLSDSYGYQPRYFCTIKQGQLTSAVPVMEIDSFLTGKRGVSLPFSDQVDPLVANRETFDELFASMVSFGRKNGWRSLYFHGGNGFFERDQSDTSYINSWIDLDGSSQSFFKKLKSSTRRNIRKAEKSGLCVNIRQTQESVEAFYRLNCLSRRDHGLPPQPLFFFKRIHAQVVAKGHGFVSLASFNGQPIAGVVIFHFNQKAIYKYGASDKRFLHLRPNNLAMWHAIKGCVEKGFSTLDLGRTDLDHHGLLQFKRGWGSSEKITHYHNYDIRRQRFQRGEPKIKSSYTLFKKLPVPLLKIIGHVLYHHVG